MDMSCRCTAAALYPCQGVISQEDLLCDVCRVEPHKHVARADDDRSYPAATEDPREALVAHPDYSPVTGRLRPPGQADSAAGSVSYLVYPFWDDAEQQAKAHAALEALVADSGDLAEATSFPHPFDFPPSHPG